jgi:hypothetical protein
LSNEYYSQELHGPYQLFDLGDFGLEDGGKIRSCKLAYATFGQLTSQKDNAILILTWYSVPARLWNRPTSGLDEPSIPISILSSLQIRSGMGSRARPIILLLRSMG